MAHKTFEEHDYMLQKLKASQDADHDNREIARDAFLFVNKNDGMWEPSVWHDNDGQPRYTFDKTSPVIDQIAGEMEKAAFDIAIKPSGGEASKEVALVLDGIVRNIQSISGANDIYNRASRRMVTTGLDGWRVVQKYVDSDAFEQDLMIERLPNFIDRVWFGPSEEPDASDCDMAWVLSAFTKDEYKEKWPEGSGKGVTSDVTSNAYSNKREVIMVGEFLYMKETNRELVLMSSGQVYEDNDDFKKISDELLALGITEKQRRNRKKRVQWVREFDNSGWLSDAKETVFSWISVVPEYANHNIFENKTIYWGAVKPLIDPQRVLNYGLSREISEGALSPRAKYWMTAKQMAGNEDTLRTLNTNNDPVQQYTVDDKAPGPPQQNGGAQINPGLRTISQAMEQILGQTAGFHAASMGEAQFNQSGVAIEKLQARGDTGSIKYFQAKELALCHTGRILVNAIPKVYGKNRNIRLLKEDGSFEMAVLNQAIVDEQTGEEVILNDLSVGSYDVTCSSGPSFTNRQSQTVAAITEIAAVDPTIIETGSDILLSNVTAPGMTLLAERKRAQLMAAGVIPEEQWTDEERAKAEQAQALAAQQPPQPDALMVAAQAELEKAQADTVNAKTDQDKAKDDIRHQQTQDKIDGFNAETNRLKAQNDRNKIELETQVAGFKVQNIEADTEGKDIDNAVKIETILRPENLN